MGINMGLLMNKFLKLFLIAGLFFSASASAAKAEVFYVENDRGRFSLSFPDSWRLTHNQKPDDMLTVLAPGDNQHASCRVRVRDDRRFVIYPVRYSGEIQRTAFSREFWFDYTREFTNPRIDHVTDGAGLGRGFASYAEASFTTAIGPKAQKRGIMFASRYHDRTYILECSAQEAAYARWRPHFLSVAKSLDFTKIIQDVPFGHYRNFLADPELVIYGRRDMEATSY